MTDFWQKLDKPFFVLAPMEAVTDVVFRQVVARAAPPDVYFSEFTNATGWTHAGDMATGGRLNKTADEKPIVAQLWGAAPEDMAKLAKHCAELGFDGIDINIGCPDKSAIKSGGGIALIKDFGLTTEMIAAAGESGLPVSVKTRLGYTKVDEYRAWIEFLLEQNLAALTVHLRTKKEMSKVAAHWEIMSDIVTIRNKLAPETLIIGNGDVTDRAHGLELVQQTGIDGIMIGRGVFHNPFVFEKTPRSHSKKELLGLLHLHLDLFDQQQTTGTQQRPFETLKRFFKIYLREFAGASELRSQLMNTTSTKQVRLVLSQSHP